jgi:hypothetical protein
MTIIAASSIPFQLIGQTYGSWPRTATNTSGGGTGDDVYQNLTTLVIPAGTMGPNSKIVIISDWDYPNSAANKILGIDFGITNVCATTASTMVMAKLLIEIQNINSLAVQKTMNGSTYTLSANARIASTVDTSAAVTVTFKTKWGAINPALETITLLGYSVWHYPGS